MKKLYVIMIAVFLVALTTVVFAVPPNTTSAAKTPAGHHDCAGFQKPCGDGSLHGGFWCHLNLSREQIDKMRKIRANNYKETRDMRYALEQKRLEMRKLFTDPKTDDATLLAKAKELNALKAKLMDKRAEMKIERRKIFTPEQLQKLDTLSMGGMRGRR